MVKKKVDPKLEPVLDKIESFDPERADRLRDNYGEEPDALPHGILSGVVAEKPAKPGHRSYYNYRFCNHCAKKGAYTQASSGEEFCKYCRPKKKSEIIPAALLKPYGGSLKLSAEPKKKSWLARLLRR